MLKIISQKKWIWACFAATIFFNLLFGMDLVSFSQPRLMELSGGKGMLDIVAGYDAAMVKEYFSAYGEEGRRLYTQYQYADFVYGIFYTLFFVGLIFRLFRKYRIKFVLILIPICVLAMDYLENILFYRINGMWPEFQQQLAEMVSKVTLMKFIFMGETLLIVVIGFILGLLSMLNSGKTVKSDQPEEVRQEQ